MLAQDYKKAHFFEKIAGYDMPLVANICASKKMMAVGFGVAEEKVLPEYLSRISHPVSPIYSSSAGMCQEHVIERNIDLASYPILLQGELDGGPYISAAVLVAKDPETSDYNIGMYRLMLRTRTELGLNLVPLHRLRFFYEKALRRKEPLEVAVCIGLHSLDQLASITPAPQGVDELSLWGGIRKEPIEMVKCKTLDLYVPSHAEIIMEGVVELTGWTENEGPYGEWPGTTTGTRKNPVFKVQAITSRHDPIYQSVTAGGMLCGYTDFYLDLFKVEANIYNQLIQAGIDVQAVRIHPSSGELLAFISIRPKVKGDGRNVLHAVLSRLENSPKYCIVVDSDIDINDENAVIWAMATRTQPKEDAILLEGLRVTQTSDPSLLGSRPFVLSKLGIDATIPTDSTLSTDAMHARFAPVKVPKLISTSVSKQVTIPVTEATERVKQILSENGPLYFAEVTRRLETVSYTSVIHAWSLLRENKTIVEEDSGRYALMGTGGTAK